uniref:Cyclin C-terminal domain-containing protein n=1 Tax=Hordeum vulgare subsp. vulgare TaxID=112509 RepID=A0A8I7BJJ4_HORVV
MTAPTAKCFLRRFVRAAQVCDEDPPLHLEFLANYVVELSLLEYSLLAYPPSLVAASAIFLMKFILQPAKHPWISAAFTDLRVFAESKCCLIKLTCTTSHCKLEAELYPCPLHTVQAVGTMRLCEGAAPPFSVGVIFLQSEKSTVHISTNLSGRSNVQLQCRQNSSGTQHASE